MKHGRNPVTRSVVAEASRMRRVLRTPPTKASQTDIPRPFREAKGARKSEANFAGDARSRSERMVLYPANVFPHRRAEEATALARGAIER